MIRACFVVAALSVSSAASAGVYAGLGVGTIPEVNGTVREMSVPTGRSTRGLIGLRIANLSLEGAVNGFAVETSRHADKTVYQASVALKLSLPVTDHLEGFARGGPERTWLSVGDDQRDLVGNGFLAGAGLEVRFDALIAMSLFVDYTFHHANLQNELGHTEADSRMMTVGLTLGL